jgi:hypothetical protein
MALIPCIEKVDCPGSDFPITNYSSEGPEQQPSFYSLYFAPSWDAFGCLSLCESRVSQNTADLCALAQEADCSLHIFCSIATTCSCVSSGGSEFFYTTPAGTFCAETQEAADALAHAYACVHCGGEDSNSSVQIGALDACACLGEAYDDTIDFSGVTPVLWIITSGTLPDGLTMTASGRVHGQPNTNGNFQFAVRAFLADGNYANRTFSISVVEITTTAITDFELGTPYSFQLAVAGGSGSYAWKVALGTLPTGLTLSSTGLISGTPTAVGSPAIRFQVIDLECDTANRTYFTPLVRLIGRSRTTIAEVRGYSEFTTPSSPPKKYMRRNWSTGMTGDDAGAKPVSVDEGISIYMFEDHPAGAGLAGTTQLAYAMCLMSGHSEINAAGQTISSPTIQLYSSCPNTDPATRVVPQVIYSGSLEAATNVPGWCYPYDTSVSYPDRPSPTLPQCSACQYPLVPDSTVQLITVANVQTPRLYAATPTITSPTNMQTIREGTDGLGFFGQGDLSLPPIFIVAPPNLGFLAPHGAFAYMAYKHNFQVDLSQEYTDALALANATIYTSNGLVAQSKPRTTGFVSTWTTVEYDLNFSNLVPGEEYFAQVTLVTDTGPAVFYASVPYSFTAVTATHRITDTVPVPANGQTISVRTPTIRFNS